jgi:hypothetical protein
MSEVNCIRKIVHARAPINFEAFDVDSCDSMHGFDHVTDLVGCRFQSRSNKVLPVRAARESDDGSSRILIPKRSRQTDERRNKIDAVGVWCGDDRFRARLDDLKFVSQPLYRRPGDEQYALDSILHLVSDPDRDCRDQTPIRNHRLLASVHHERGRRSERALRHALREAGLPEQSTLLIADGCSDGYLDTEQGPIGETIDFR